MKKIFLSCFSILAFAAVTAAQKEANPGMNELKEKVIPWDKMIPPKGNAVGKSTTIQGKPFTPYQIGLIDTFTNWIKKSYTPVGGLPQAARIALPDAVEYRPYVPHGTGVVMHMWVPCYDATGKNITRAQPASSAVISIFTNHIPGMEPATWLNTSSQYYFTMYYDTKGKLVNAADQLTQEPYLKEIQSRIGNYFMYFTGRRINVILMPGNELPLVQVSKGEVLMKGEEAVKRAFANKKMSDTQLAEALANIKKWNDKYKNRLEETAFVNTEQLGIYTFTSIHDPFEKVQASQPYMFPVYKIKPEMYELCKKDKPQWVCISWEIATEKSKTVDREIHKAMTNNFNFDFMYNYFFASEKVKGKFYQSLKL